MYESIHAREKSKFGLSFWVERYRKSESHRVGTWDYQARQCSRVRENDIPDGNKLPNGENMVKHFYKDNFPYKQIKWWVAMLTGSEVSYDLESSSSIRDENTEILECALNMHAYQMDVPRHTQYALYDTYYTGMGYVRRWWDKHDISVSHKTGRPKIEHVESMKMFIDPATQKEDKSDMRFIFHVEKFHWRELAKQYPNLKDELESQSNEHELVELVIVQYRTDVLVDSVFVTDNGQEPVKEWLCPLDECQKFLESGESLPDGMDISMPFKIRKTFWYEARFFPALDKVLQYPEYVGESCLYHIFAYESRKGSAYSVGLCYYLLDMLYLNVIMLTSLAQQVFKNQKNEKIIEGDSLLNQDEYLEHGYKLGVNPVTDPVWRDSHPGVDPVKPLPLPEIPRGLELMHNLILQTAKDATGVTDTLEGKSEYSGMSGVAIAQHLTAGKTYHKQEVARYLWWLKDIGKELMYDISKNMQHPHYMNFLDSGNEMGYVKVNDPFENSLTYEPDNVTITCSLTEDVEVLKQLRREMAVQLFQMGIVSGRQVLEYTDFKNPERIWRDAKEEQGVMEIIDFLRDNPQLMEQLQIAMQGGAA